MQQQLAQAEGQMARESKQSQLGTDGVSSDSAASAAAQVNQISAALQMATAELAQLMLQSGQTTGMIDTQA
ncbi:MAG: unnamed protein product [uncultured Paraburkholderia sp.]|nr:MAG: hypothetical protein PPHEMADE_2511 [uncultured Paraburkholderia sp.]CAH2924033.1 MAG: unnamed protein product [uncultured Paraburkholderia sp.]